MIYTTGTIAINGNTVTGTGTDFSSPLSLIRVGCTLIAIGNPVQIFTITEIKSGAKLSVTPAANPAIPAGTKFSILLSDSISVDGLALDVAEALRYFQSKATEVSEAIEPLQDIDFNALTAQINQVHTDSAQVSVDKATVQQYKTDSESAKSAAEAAKDKAVLAQTAAETANTSAQAARDAAQAARDAAHGYRNEAEQFKNEVDTDQFAKVSNNLSDLTDKSAARQTLNAIGVGDYGIGGGAPVGSWDTVDGSTLIATNTGSPLSDISVAGVHVKFGQNHAVQFAARNSRFFWRTKENGALQNWCEAVKPMDYGLGIESSAPPPNTQACFFSESLGAPTWAPTNGAGFQSAYSPLRVAQVMVGALPALYYRWNTSGNAQVSASTAPWSRVQDAGTSDARVKDIKGNLNVEAALDNINRLEFKLFRYTFDEPERSTRRGIIAQQAATVDREYVHDHEVPGMMTLDLNPLVADCLAAIKALRARDEANKAEIAELKAAVADLKAAVAALTKA